MTPNIPRQAPTLQRRSPGFSTRTESRARMTPTSQPQRAHIGTSAHLILEPWCSRSREGQQRLPDTHQGSTRALPGAAFSDASWRSCGCAHLGTRVGRTVRVSWWRSRRPPSGSAHATEWSRKHLSGCRVILLSGCPVRGGHELSRMRPGSKVEPLCAVPTATILPSGWMAMSWPESKPAAKSTVSRPSVPKPGSRSPSLS